MLVWQGLQSGVTMFSGFLHGFTPGAPVRPLAFALKKIHKEQCGELNSWTAGPPPAIWVGVSSCTLFPGFSPGVPVHPLAFACKKLWTCTAWSKCPEGSSCDVLRTLDQSMERLPALGAAVAIPIVMLPEKTEVIKALPSLLYQSGDAGRPWLVLRDMNFEVPIAAHLLHRGPVDL